MDAKTARQYIDRAADGQMVEVQAGVWLLPFAEIQAEADSWDDDDPAKALDYSSSPYWLHSDDGTYPVAVATAQDLIDAID